VITFKWKVPDKPIFKEARTREYFAQNKLRIFNMIMPTIQAGVVSRTPVGATGNLRKSFLITYGDKAKLTSDLEYAPATNDGRRAKPVALEAKAGIIKWIRLSTRGQDYFAALREKYKKITHEQAAFLLMRAKKRHATPGQKFFEAGIESVQDVVQGIYKNILSKMKAEMA
jgi:hypothetical protein